MYLPGLELFLHGKTRKACEGQEVGKEGGTAQDEEEEDAGGVHVCD